MPTLLMTGRRLSNGSLAQLDTDRHELFTVPSQADSLEADEATISWTAAVVPCTSVTMVIVTPSPSAGRITEIQRY